MGSAFLVLFIIAEIILTVLTFTRFGEKAQWLKNRVIVTAAETALLLAIILLPTTHMKWRFAAALTVLIIRLLIEGICFLAKRRNAEGKKNKAGVILGFILSVVIVGLSATPALIFSNYNGLEPTGEYDVRECSAILVDKNRPDTFENDGSNREVPAHFYYPDAAGSYPLVVFSHGAFGYYQSNFSTYEELASNGYIVVSLDHPHHAFFTTDTDGKTITVDSNFINTALRVSNGEVTDSNELYKIEQEWMELRTRDENFVLDTIKEAVNSGSLNDTWHTESESEVLSVLKIANTDKIGLLGHSMGGATSVGIGRQRDDIDAVIVLDGTMLTEVVSVKDGQKSFNEDPYPVPILDFTKESDYNERMQTKSGNAFMYVNDFVIDHAKDGRMVVFKNAGHMDFTDLPLISPVLGDMLGSGDVDNEQFMNTVNGIVLNWFDYYLKGEGSLNIAETY